MDVIAAPVETFRWLTSRALNNASSEMKAIAAIDGGGRIHGMVGFDGWTPNAVVMSIALDNPAALRHLLRPAFHYAFIQANRGVAMATVKGSNTRSLRLCRKVGFREAHRVKDGIAVGDDIVIFEMRREECRWLSSNQRRAA